MDTSTSNIKNLGGGGEITSCIYYFTAILSDVMKDCTAKYNPTVVT